MQKIPTNAILSHWKYVNFLFRNKLDVGHSEAKTRAPTDAFNPNKNINEGEIDRK